MNNKKKKKRTNGLGNKEFLLWTKIDTKFKSVIFSVITILGHEIVSYHTIPLYGDKHFATDFSIVSPKCGEINGIRIVYTVAEKVKQNFCLETVLTVIL